MFLEQTHTKRKKWPYVVASICALLGGGIIFAYQYITHLTPEKLVNNPIVQKYVPEEQRDIVEHLPALLGTDSPKTYLVLLLNNTELRPGGGFIGVYATVKMDKAHPEILALEGTELLDGRATSSAKVIPPKPLSDQLGVDRWYFRDSNWSPDFAESAKQSLALYRAEGGVAADSIDAVIAVTPTVLEELMNVTGPFTINGTTFTAKNVVERLEYEVEYGYRERGLTKDDRKNIIEPFMQALIAHAKETAVSHSKEYLEIGNRMVEQKHILAYALNTDMENVFVGAHAAGTVSSTPGDYLLWVDANLAALKTDHAMKRTVHYQIRKNINGKYIATAQMTYEHGGTFDWRTTRYRTYARVFVPNGSRLVGSSGAMKKDRSKEPGTVDQGQELGKQWFGAFIAIEPGEKKTLAFSYELPDTIATQIEQKMYTLVVQKQLGSIANGLTLDLDFGTTIVAATPGEEPKEWGNTLYTIKTDLSVDRTFKVSF